MEGVAGVVDGGDGGVVDELPGEPGEPGSVYKDERFERRLIKSMKLN